MSRMEAAPDLGYDDESVELNRRLALGGLPCRWAAIGNQIEVFTPEAGDASEAHSPITS